MGTPRTSFDRFQNFDHLGFAFDDFDDEFSDVDIDDEISTYNQYFEGTVKHPIKAKSHKKEVICYEISNGISIMVDKSLNLTNPQLLKIISNHLI